MAETSQSPDPWSGPVVFGAVLVGLALRVAAAHTLGPHIDEAESVLGARMVATTGLPILPSGLVFLQGLTMSYLLPLFDRSADPFDLSSLRLLSAFAGTAAVYASARLARVFGAPPLLASLVAVAIALDPASIQWSAHVRPYALLQLLSTVLLTLWVRVLDAPARRRSIALSIVFAIGVFTHVAVALLVPGMALVTLAIHRRDLMSTRRDLTLTFVSFALPILVFFAINTLTGASSSGAHVGPSFIGDHTLSFTSVLSPQLDPWRALFQQSSTRDFMSFLVVFCGTALLMRRSDPAALALLGTYVTPVLFVAAFTTDSLSRYLLHIQPMSYTLVALGAYELLKMGGAWRALAAGAALLTFAHGLSGAYNRLDRPSIDPDYSVALRWLEGQHASGEPVLAAMTAVTRFSTIPQSDFRFLPGSEDAKRTGRYVRTAADGTLIDYWSGVPAITTTRELCTFLADHPDSWLVVDDERLRAAWAFGGPMQEVIRGGAAEAFRTAGAATIYRTLAHARWSEKAVEACSARAAEPGAAAGAQPAAGGAGKAEPE